MPLTEKKGSAGALDDTRDAWIRGRRSTRLPVLLLGLVVAAAYANSLDGVFLLDEDRYIINNPVIRRFRPLDRLLTSSQRPVVDLSLALNYSLGELNPWGYHLLNITIHVAATLTLFGLVRRTLEAVRNNGRLAPDQRDQGGFREIGPNPSKQASGSAPGTWTAFCVALLWAIHPLHTQSVTYVIQRAESMMGLFYLLTLYGLVRGVEPGRRRFWTAAAILFCVLGMGSKPVMVTAPVTALLYDRLFLARSWTDVLRRRRFVHLGLALSWLVPLGYGVFQGTIGGSADADATVGFGFKGISPLDYFLTQLWAITRYLRLAAWPHPLCFDYGWPVVTDWSTLLPCVGLLGALVTATIWLTRRGNPLAFSGWSFLLILLPTSSIIPIRDTIFEYRMYLPLAAVVTAVVVTVRTILFRCTAGQVTSPSRTGAERETANRENSSGKSRTSRRETRSGASRRPSLSFRGICTVLMVLSAVPLFAATRTRNRTYASARTMWEDVLRLRPGNARAYDKLGTLYAEQGNFEEAIPLYQRALEIRSDYLNAMYNLGTALVRVGQGREGLETYKQVLLRDPRHRAARLSLADTRARLGELEAGLEDLRRLTVEDSTDAMAPYLMGNLLGENGRVEEAMEAYETALARDPTLVAAHYGIGNAWQRVNRWTDAVEAYDRALVLDPNLPSALFNRGNALKKLGRHEEAVTDFKAVLRLDGRHVKARFMLGETLAEWDRLVEAATVFRELEKERPDDPFILSALGDVLLRQGEYAEAAQRYRRVLALRPQDSRARRSLEAAEQALGRHAPP